MGLSRKEVINVCCCRPDHPHDEMSKLQFIRDDDEDKEYIDALLDYPIFGDASRQRIHDGLKILKGDYKDMNQLQNYFKIENLEGRKPLISEIVKFIFNSSRNGPRILHVSGESGNGKTQIVNYAARYALHGRVMLDGAIYLNLEHKESKQAVIQ